MTEFRSAYSYERFAESVYRKARFIHEESTRDFLATLVETSSSRTINLPKGHRLWRAQLGFSPRFEREGREQVELRGPHPPARMVPTPEFVGDGRVNPRGIPCLYLSTGGSTAMSEVRPWVSAYVSLAQFEVLRDCKVVNCSGHPRRAFAFPLRAEAAISAMKKESDVWGEIAHAFSKPVTPTEPIRDYIPTQILAEAFRAQGFDGIVYKSELGTGHNVALFDLAVVELACCELHQTKAVEYRFDQVDHPYFMDKYAGAHSDGDIPQEIDWMSA
jgi:hypothetical protein